MVILNLFKTHEVILYTKALVKTHKYEQFVESEKYLALIVIPASCSRMHRRFTRALADIVCLRG